MALLWPSVYYFYGLYQVRRHRSRVEEGLAVLGATGLATLVLAGLATFYRGFSYSRAVFLLFFALDVVFVFAGRTAIRRYLEEAWRHGVGVRHVLVVGAGRLGRAVVDKLLEHPEAGLRAVGFLDDDADKQANALPRRAGARPDRGRRAHRRGTRRRTPSSSRCRSRRTARCSRVLQEVGRTVADVRVVPDLLQYITFRAGVEDLDGLPVVHLDAGAAARAGRAWSSAAIDLAISGAALVALSPVFAAIAARHPLRRTAARCFYRQAPHGARRPAVRRS